MDKVKIIITNNNVGRLEGSAKVLLKLYNAFRIKHPNAWHIMMYQRNNRWDGYIDYISKTGTFKLGLLSKVFDTLIGWGLKPKDIKIIDTREPLNITPVIPDTIGDKTLRDDQKKALKNLLFHKINGVPFLIGAGDYSVGFGKTLLYAAIFKAFHYELKTAVLLNDSDLFEQFKREIPYLLPGKDIVFVRGNKVFKWGDFNVIMVQSLVKNLDLYKRNIADIKILLLEEADVIDNRTYKTVIPHFYNTQIRIGLSGTLYMSKLKKHLVHNMNVMSFIGDKIDQVRLSDQIKKGSSTPVVIKMIYVPGDSGNTNNYPEEYKENIINNPTAYNISFTRIMLNAQYDRFPMVVVCNYIDHCERLYKYFTERAKELSLPWVIKYMHHKTPNRNQLVADFRDGKIDILISTTIIARGKNLPTMRYLQNITSMDSQEKSIQILGRLVRKHESKDKGYIDDLVFPGKYLKRHGNHRKVYYKNQKLKVIEVKGKVTDFSKIKR